MPFHPGSNVTTNGASPDRQAAKKNSRMKVVPCRPIAPSLGIHASPNGWAFSGEPTERSERPERRRGRRVRCNATLGRSSIHLRLTEIAIVGPGIACA